MSTQITGQAQGVVQTVSQKSGTPAAISTGWHNELLKSDLFPRYAYLVLSGLVFTVSNPAAGVLSAAGNVSPIAAAGTPILALFNPANSGKNLVMLAATAVVFSSTAAPLSVVLNVVDGQVITAVTNVTPVNALTLKASGSNASAFSLTALTGSTVMRMYRGLLAAAGAATAGMNQPGKDELAGELVIPPGGVVAVATGAAGTAAQVLASFTWAELPI
jgi:hypothetical protein